MDLSTVSWSRPRPSASRPRQASPRCRATNGQLVAPPRSVGRARHAVPGGRGEGEGRGTASASDPRSVGRARGRRGAGDNPGDSASYPRPVGRGHRGHLVAGGTANCGPTHGQLVAQTYISTYSYLPVAYRPALGDNRFEANPSFRASPKKWHTRRRG